jgi:SAM-dependent methyltransferase
MLKREEVLDVLQFNNGFDNPAKWVNYAISHRFHKTASVRLNACPDCGSHLLRYVGQFIYYSTLIRIMKCECGLVFADTRLDPKVIQAHFERTYKNECYFTVKRRKIFSQIARLADRAAPASGKVLDIGGAKGHLLAILKERRPDLELVLNDLSRDACQWGKTTYGFQTITGGIGAIEQIQDRFDVVVLSDVIYYEPEIQRLWSVLPRLVKDGGTIIMRMPNIASIILFWQAVNRIFVRNDMQDSILFMNPEHLYIFTRRYLLRRIRGVGFNDITVAPSDLLISKNQDLFRSAAYFLCKLLWLLTFKKITMTPSMLLIARRR